MKDLKMKRRDFLAITGLSVTSAMLFSWRGWKFLPSFETTQSGAEPMAIQAPSRYVQTACSPNCFWSCTLNAEVKDGRIVRFEPFDHLDPRYKSICLRGLTHTERVYHPDRIKHPMRRVGERGEGKFVRITWEEALDTIAEKIKEATAEDPRSVVFWPVFGTYGVISAFAPHRLMSLIGGTVVSGGIDTAVGSGYQDMFGRSGSWTFTDIIEPHGFYDSKLIVAWGANPGETQLHLMRFIFDAIENGARVITIDPRFSVTASKSHLWVPVRVGTDAALALSIAHVIVKNGWYDEAFLKKYTVAPFLVRLDDRKFLRLEDKYLVIDSFDGRPKTYDSPSLIDPSITGEFEVNGIKCKPAFQLLVERLDEYPPEKAERITEVPKETIERLAYEFATKKPIALITMFGQDHYFNADVVMRAKLLLLVLTGNVGIRGSGVFAFSGSYMYAPFDWAGYLAPTGKWYNVLNPIKLYDAAVYGDPHPIKVLWCQAGNAINQDVGNLSRFVKDALPKIDLVVVVDFMPCDTVKYADIVLPACTWFEKTDLIPAGAHFYNVVQHKVIDPMFESRSDFQILKELAKRLGYEEYFQGNEEDFIDLVLKPMNLSYKDFDKGPIRMNMPDPYYPFHDMRFPTESGKIEFYTERLISYDLQLPKHIEPKEASPYSEKGKKYPFVFMNPHSRWKVHSQFATQPWLNEIVSEPLVEMNPSDAEEKGIADGDLVEVYNDRGKIRVRVKYNEAIRPRTIVLQEGWWSSQLNETFVNSLTPDGTTEYFLLGPNWCFADTAVDVRKV